MLKNFSRGALTQRQQEKATHYPLQQNENTFPQKKKQSLFPHELNQIIKLQEIYIYLTEWKEHCLIKFIQILTISNFVDQQNQSINFHNPNGSLIAFIIKIVTKIVKNMKDFKLCQQIEMFHQVTIIQNQQIFSKLYLEFAEFQSNELGQKQLKVFVETLRRSRYCKEELTLNLIKIHMSQMNELKALTQEQQSQTSNKQKNSVIMLENLFNMIHLSIIYWEHLI